MNARATEVSDSNKHRVVSTDTQSTLTGPSTQLTCACGWFGHSTMWTALAHGTGVPPLPWQEARRPPVSRDVLRRAIYGDRPRRWR